MADSSLIYTATAVLSMAKKVTRSTTVAMHLMRLQCQPQYPDSSQLGVGQFIYKLLKTEMWPVFSFLFLHDDQPATTGFIHILTSQIPGLSRTFQCRIQGPFQ